MKRINLFLILGMSVGVLCACSSTKEQFDFSKKAPDEFAVVTRAPLEMPTTFELPPPRLGTQRPQEASPEDQAKEVLFGQQNTPTQAEIFTSGEAVLLEKSGATSVDANIRDVVDAETQETAKENTSTFNRILGRAGKKVDTPADVIDPVKERERIMQAQTNPPPQ